MASIEGILNNVSDDWIPLSLLQHKYQQVLQDMHRRQWTFDVGDADQMDSDGKEQ
jgi:hypothetical protein